MTAPVPPGTSPAPPAAPAPRGSRLRPAALAVAGLAALWLLLALGRALVGGVARGSGAADFVVPAIVLADTVVTVLLAAGVVLLVQRAALSDARTRRLSLIVLGLLTLTLVLDPLWSMLSHLVTASRGLQSDPEPLLRVLTLGTTGIDVLCTLVLGVLAALLAARAPAGPGAVRSPGGPTGLAAALCVLALMALVMFSTEAILSRLLLAGSPPIAGSPLIASLTTVPPILVGLARALMIPVGALLIARTTGTPRGTVWGVLAVLWASRIATSLALGLLTVQLGLGADPEVFRLWTGLASAIHGVSAAAALLLTVVALVLVVAQGRRAARPHEGSPVSPPR